MLALKGIIQGNTVIVEGEDIRAYEGNDVIVTILDFPYGEKKRICHSYRQGTECG